MDKKTLEELKEAVFDVGENILNSNESTNDKLDTVISLLRKILREVER